WLLLLSRHLQLHPLFPLPVIDEKTAAVDIGLPGPRIATLLAVAMIELRKLGVAIGIETLQPGATLGCRHANQQQHRKTGFHAGVHARRVGPTVVASKMALCI